MPERLPYDEAMLFSSVRLKIQDPELKQGNVEKVTVKTVVGAVERPWGIEGGFAVVYKFRTKSGMFRALRCFRVPMSEDTQFRYERIEPYFADHAHDITAGFKYHDAGIVVKEQGKPPNQTYPVIEMDWIDGVTLLDKIDELCLKRDCAALKSLSEQWVGILRTMRQANIAHGDLAGVNVMVRENGQLVLIDYDGVYIPEFAGLTQVLLGQMDYQHPQMAQRSFNEWMDAFSALMIYTSLLALQVQPQLWDKYAKRGPQGKLLDVNILFTQQDFKEPHQSELIRELESLNDQRVKLFVQELKQACLQPVDEVRFPFQKVDPHYDKKQALARLAKAIKADDDEQIVRCWVPILQLYDEAQHHRPRVQLAERRVQALMLLRDALRQQNIQHIVARYDPVLDNCKNVTNDERQLLSFVRSFAQAYQDNNDEALLTVSETMQHMNLLKNITFTAQEQQRLVLIRQRKEALQLLRDALKSKSIELIAAAYQPGQQIYSGLAENERQLAEAAHRFMQAYQSDNDETILTGYTALQNVKNRHLLTLTSQQQQRAILVRERSIALAKFRAALASKNLRHVAASYSTVLDQSKSVTQEEREQLLLVREFVQAYDNDGDNTLVTAYTAIQQSPQKDAFVFTTQEQQRVTLAQQRKAALVKFKFALISRSPRQIVVAYDSLLDRSRDVTPEEREELTQARNFVQGYDADDDEALMAVDARNLFTFTAQEQQRLTLARQRHATLANLRYTLASDNRKAQQIVIAYDEATLNTSIQVTKTEQDIVDAARRYLAMREAIQTGIRENNDDLIRRTYDSALAQQFADFSPDEQKYIDKVKMFLLLEEVLHNREYGQAIRMAQKIQMTTGKELSDSLKFQMRRATMRFIRNHDLTQLAVHIIGRADGNYAVARWTWPVDDLVQDAFLVWQTDAWPQRPQEKNVQDPAWKHVRAWRRSYQAEGTCEFPIGRNTTHIYVRAYAALPDRWDSAGKWRFADGNDPTSRAEVISPQVKRRTPG